jgi:hypothetical protein
MTVATDKADDDEKPKARLHGMLVEEVSLVDRAANRKRFLIVKRDGDAMTTALQSDGNGNLVTGDDDAAKLAKADADAAEAKAKADAEAKAKADEEEKTKAAKAKTEAAMKAFSDASAALATLLTPGESGAVDADLAKQVRESTNLLGSVIDGAAATRKGDQVSDENKSEIEKAGARMKRDRLDRFRKALDTLQGLLKEFVPENMAKAALEARVNENADVGGKLLGAIEKLTARVEAIAKRQADDDAALKAQGERLEEIAKGGARSNALAVDESQQSSGAEVSWPLDMNRPIDRESVTKDTSFFD